MAREVQPYDFEPEYSDSEVEGNDTVELVEEVDIPPQPVGLQDRVGQPAYWCLCGLCQPLPSPVECQCCLEADRVIEKRDSLSEEVIQGCITNTDLFDTVCLTKDVLHITLLMIHDVLMKGALTDPVPNCSYRLAAYRQFTYWIYGKLGKRNRIPIPSCVVTAIRKRYPEEDGQYEGYHEPEPVLMN